MKNKIIVELLNKKQMGKKEFVDYVNKRIQILDENSESTIIGVNENSIYSKYIGKNVKVCVNTNLLENDSINLPIPYMQFDGDDRIIEILYNSLQQSNDQDSEILNVLAVLQNVLPMTFMDSFASMVNCKRRNEIYELNAKNGKITKYSEIKNALLSMCLEKATLFHNLCKILDIDCKMICGTFEKNGVLETHAYNIVKVDNSIFLIDLANCIGKSEKNEKISIFPLAKLTNDDYNKLLNGEKINIDMSIFTNIACKSNCKSQIDIYGVGITKEDKIKLLKQNIINNEQRIQGLFNKESKFK